MDEKVSGMAKKVTMSASAVKILQANYNTLRHSAEKRMKWEG
jgi:hypothetical protein